MPGKLEFSFNSTRSDDFVLDKEIMTMGRRDDNDIRIDNLAVSGHHAKLLTIFDDSALTAPMLMDDRLPSTHLRMAM